MIFVRNFLGGPFAGSVQMVPSGTRVIAVGLGLLPIGRYVICNLGWTWHPEGLPA